MFATRDDLLARCNVRRLFQLAVPTDRAVPVDAALRIAMAGGDLSGYGTEAVETLGLSLDVIDRALADADEMVAARGIPTDYASPLLARLSSTIALYYLQGAERMTDGVRKGYEDAVETLKAHSRGDISLVPDAVDGSVEDDVVIERGSYRPRSLPGGEDWPC